VFVDAHVPVQFVAVVVWPYQVPGVLPAPVPPDASTVFSVKHVPESDRAAAAKTWSAGAPVAFPS
jgi:hypothetical protein